MKFAAYVPELVMSQIEAVYLYNANLAFRHYANKLSAAIRIFSHIKVTSFYDLYWFVCEIIVKLHGFTI